LLPIVNDVPFSFYKRNVKNMKKNQKKPKEPEEQTLPDMTDC